ncbi:hypothetical protein STSP_66930 [Streptomyces jeddahensis]|uniref:Uncharacterized protein n=1 Tax=Streptomyces jeddahensis TaxID=1716141 RepID=A0A177HIC1_9ACTN|nr:hypothetical protein STSP_66930 [Streptomyces jeddahensis]
MKLPVGHVQCDIAGMTPFQHGLAPISVLFVPPVPLVVFQLHHPGTCSGALRQESGSQGADDTQRSDRQCRYRAAHASSLALADVQARAG